MLYWRDSSLLLLVGVKFSHQNVDSFVFGFSAVSVFVYELSSDDCEVKRVLPRSKAFEYIFKPLKLSLSLSLSSQFTDSKFITQLFQTDFSHDSAAWLRFNISTFSHKSRPFSTTFLYFTIFQFNTVNFSLWFLQQRHFLYFFSQTFWNFESSISIATTSRS